MSDRALSHDPPIDPAFPAQTLPYAIASGGVNLNALLYTPAGAAPAPVVLLLHGLPGNEQNLDLAQTLRRAGWAVLTIHYRGSWGGPGTFSFAHCLEDAAAALDWIADAPPELKLDPREGKRAKRSAGEGQCGELRHCPSPFAAARLFPLPRGEREISYPRRAPRTRCHT